MGGSSSLEIDQTDYFDITQDGKLMITTPGNEFSLLNLTFQVTVQITSTDSLKENNKISDNFEVTFNLIECSEDQIALPKAAERFFTHEIGSSESTKIRSEFIQRNNDCPIKYTFQ